jgi:hypothetical protein
MELKVRALDVPEEKSVQEVEQELLQKHEEVVGTQLNKEPEIPKIDLSVGRKVEEVKPEAEPVAEVIEQKEEEKPYELKEEDVLSYIGKRYNKQINSFDDLIAERKDAEDMPEDVAAYLKFKKETGRGFEDFLSLNKDYDSMNPEQLLKEYLRNTQDGLDDDDIETLMDDYRYDEDIDDESKIKKIKIETKKVISQAKKYFNTQKEKYKIPLESRSVGVSDEDKEEFEAYREYTKQAKTLEEEDNRKRQWFSQKTDEVFDREFKGFEFNVNDKKLSFNPGDAAELKKLQSNPSNFINKFLDESGLIKDAVGYHKSLAIAMNPDRFAKFFYEQGMADATEDSMRKIKNINMTERRAPEVMKSKDGMQVKAVNPDSGRGLKIRSIKRI